MKFANRLKFTAATATSAAVLTFSTKIAGYRSLGEAISAGDLAVGDKEVPIVVEDSAGNWENSYYTVTNSTTLTRESISASSNGGQAAVFSSALTAGCQVFAEYLRRLSGVRDVPFSTSVPLDFVGQTYMPRTKVSAGMTITPVGAVRGALAYMRLLGDGSNEPSFSGTLEWDGPQYFDKTNDVENQVQLFSDGTSVFRRISQANNAQPVPVAATAVTLSGPSSGIVSTASSAFTVGVNGTISGTVVVTPNDGGAGGTFNPATVSLTSVSPTATFTYTPASTGNKTISVTNNGGLANPASITYAVSAAATASGAPTIGTATAGDGSATVQFAAPANNGGSAIIDYTVTASPGGATATGTSSPITVTGLTNGTAYTFTVKARNTVDSSAASAASNSVTPAAAAPSTTIRLTGAKSADVVESSAAPWTYTSTGGSTGATGAVSSQSIPAAGDAEIIWKVVTNSTDFMVGVASNGGGLVDYNYFDSQALWSNGGNGYKNFGNKSVTSTVKSATGDLIRYRKKNAAANADYLIDYDWSISKDNGVTWAVIISNDPGTNGGRKTQQWFRVVPGGGAVLSVVSQTGAS